MKLTLIEAALWIVVPAFISIIFWVLLRKNHWFKNKVVLSLSFSVMTLGLLLSPSVLCAENCNRITGTFLMASVLSTIVYLLATLIMYFSNKASGLK